MDVRINARTNESAIQLSAVALSVNQMLTFQCWQRYNRQQRQPQQANDNRHRVQKWNQKTGSSYLSCMNHQPKPFPPRTIFRSQRINRNRFSWSPIC